VRAYLHALNKAVARGGRGPRATTERV